MVVIAMVIVVKVMLQETTQKTIISKTLTKMHCGVEICP